MEKSYTTPPIAPPPPKCPVSNKTTCTSRLYIIVTKLILQFLSFLFQKLRHHNVSTLRRTTDSSRFTSIKHLNVLNLSQLLYSLFASGNNFELVLNGLTQTSIKRSLDNAGKVNSNSRDYMNLYVTGDRLCVKASSSCVSCRVAWTLFRVDDVMTYPRVAFSIGRTSNFPAAVSPLEFDLTLLDIGNGWNSITHKYTMPITGIYIIYFSLGCREYKKIGVYLMKNNAIIAKTYCYNEDHGTPATTSEAWLQYFNAGDTIFIEPMDIYDSGYSDSTLQTSLSGFLYNPRWKQNSAWSVGRTTSWNGLSSSSDLSPLPFDHVWINEGNVWNSDKVTCHQTGLYVVRLNSRMHDRDPLLVIILMCLIKLKNL